MGISANHGYADNISVVQLSRIVNVASFMAGPVAPGELIEIAAN